MAVLHADCWYCRSWVGNEWDHAPIPKRHGGTAVVPACYSCHTRKDRIGIDKWDATAMSKAIVLMTPLLCDVRPFDVAEDVWTVIGDEAVEPMVRLGSARFYAFICDLFVWWEKENNQLGGSCKGWLEDFIEKNPRDSRPAAFVQPAFPIAFEVQP